MRRTAKPSQNVKFTVGESPQDEPLEGAVGSSDTLSNDSHSQIPMLNVPQGDLSTAPLTPEWQSRTTAAAEGAHSKATRLASKLGSNPGSRRGSQVGTPSIYADPDQQGKPTLKSTPLEPSLTPESSKSPTSGKPKPSRLSKLKHTGGLRVSKRPRANATSAGYHSPPLRPLENIHLRDIPLESLEKPKRPFDIEDSTDEDEDVEEDAMEPRRQSSNAQNNLLDAKRIVRSYTHGLKPLMSRERDNEDGTRTPAADKRLYDLDYVPAPDQYKQSVLGALLSSKLSAIQTQQQHTPGLGLNKVAPAQGHKKHASASDLDSRASSPYSSGTVTPSKQRPKWYGQNKTIYSRTPSTSSMATLLASAVQSASVGLPVTTGAAPRPNLPRSKSSGMISLAVDKIKSGVSHLHSQSDLDTSEEVILEVADIIGRRKYLIKLCAALMMYGAPTHRLEEYMRTSARALQIQAEFLYLPGSMLCCFIDSAIYSTNVEMVRVPQGVDLGRFKDTYSIYKLVMHGLYNADQGLEELEGIMSKRDRFNVWIRVLAFGIAGISVGPFAFSARPIDFGPIFILSCLLGIMQLIMVPRSEQFSHVFEVFTAVLTAFVARGLGSIYNSSGNSILCFSAMAQSSIALILPGYIVLNAALELQSRNMVSGSVRMVYAIIYTLFLGFGLLVGTTIFGLMYSRATSDVVCHTPPWWDTAGNNYKLIYVKFIFVPIFTVCLAVINHAKFNQMPHMVVIAFCGYQANFWISTKVANNVQVANAIGAFVVGCLANLYSRFFHGLAAATMLPAIFVQVPSGLAASGSLVAGITSANQITGNATGISIVNNGTQGFLNAQNTTTAGTDNLYGGTIFNVGYGMVQVAIGISVGLYLSALIVYPYGKRKSGLFSF